MMSKRRIAWIIVAILVVTVAGGGLWWHIRRNTGPHLLARADLALRAGKLDKAVDLADRYVAKYPDDWRGYRLKATAFLRQAKYDQARSLLDEAVRRQPGEVSLVLASSQTHAYPAMAVLGKRDLKAEDLRSAVAEIEKANALLAPFRAQKDSDALDVKQEMGFNHVRIAQLKYAVADLAEQEAKVAEAARDNDTAEKKRERFRYEAAQAELSERSAIQALLSVVERDPSRGRPAETVVELCQRVGDRDSLARARKAIEALSSPPPAAAVKLAMADLEWSPGQGSAARAEVIKKVTERLEVLQKAHPTDATIKLARAGLAMATGKATEAEGLASEIIQGEPQNTEAQLLRARALLAVGRKTEAEKELFVLKTRRPGDSRCLYWYAVAAQSTGNVGLASEAMRSLADALDRQGGPSDVQKQAMKHSILKQFATLLLNGGHYEQAFREAQACYESDPSDPEAFRLLVDAARAADQMDFARAALRKAWRQPDEKGAPRTARALVAIAEGLLSLGNREEARQVLDDVVRLAQEAPPKAADEALAVARAYSLKGRHAEAEKLLSERLTADPHQPWACFYLGALCAETGRRLQAQEFYRKAVLLDAGESSYRLALARTLIDTGELDDAEQVLKFPGIASHIGAELELLRIALLRGRPLKEQDWPILRNPRAGKRYGWALASIYLTGGKLDLCVSTCLDKLAQDPNDVEVRGVLAEAYLRQGKRQESAGEWRKVIGIRPGSLPSYLSLARVLLSDLAKTKAATRPAARMPMDEFRAGLKQVEGELEQASEVKGMAFLASAELHAQYGLFERSKELCEKALKDSAMGQDMLYAAHMLRARSLARAGALEQALAGLDEVTAKVKGMARTRAMFAKAEVLVDAAQKAEAEKRKAQIEQRKGDVDKWQAEAGSRLAQAEGILAQLCKEAEADKDPLSLPKPIEMLGRIGRLDNALAACKRMRELLPRDPRGYLLEAGLLARAGRDQEAPELYERAIELQPSDFRPYETLANLYHRLGQPTKALEVLGRLEKGGAGTAGQAIGIRQQGVLLAQRGLQTQAIEKFKALEQLGDADSPSLLLARAQSLGALGRRAEAVAAIRQIPPYAPQYADSRLLEAALAETPEGKLAVLADLAKRRPTEEAFLLRQMQVYLEAKQPAEAVRAFEAFRAASDPNQPLPAQAAGLATLAAIRAGDLPGAGRIALDANQASPAPQWRLLAAIICMDDRPEEAARLIGKADQAGMLPAMIGLCLAQRKGDQAAVKAWTDRLDSLGAEAAKQMGRETAFESMRLLRALVVGDAAAAKASAEKMQSLESGPAARELAASASSPKATEEAIRLVKIAIARSLDQRDLARRWAMEVLEARPACQWAAAQVVLAGPEPAELEKASALLEPKDCELAKALRASLLLRSGKAKEAAEVFASLARPAGQKPDPAYLIQEAAALEEAGLPAEALDRYRQVLQMTPSLVAANNAACLTVQLYPKDAARLAEARGWADQALKEAQKDSQGAPPHILDTVGWISHLQGNNAEALRLLRQAVRGLPDSPDVHYHVGRLESLAGDPTLAQWHLAAAVEQGQKLQAAGKKLPTPTAEAVRLAKEELARTPQLK